MKKLLVLIISITLIIGLSACDSTSQDLTYLEEQISDLQEDLIAQQSEIVILQEDVEELENRFNNLVVSTGLNGQVAYYENIASVSEFTTLGIETIAKEADYIDKLKFPDYIWDENGDYVTVNDLGNLLTQKYFGINSTTTLGFQYRMTIYKPADISIDDFMARLSMMIIELSYYDFYTIDSPELYIIINTGASQSMKVRMSLLVSDSYSLHPAIFWEQLMDTSVTGFSYNTIMVEEYYNDYIANETFIGYVLDYK